MLAILGIYIMSTKFSAGEIGRGIKISSQQMVVLGTLNSGCVTGGPGGILGRGGVGSGVGCPRQSDEGWPVPLRLHHGCGCFALPWWQRRHLSGWFWRSIATCVSITASTWIWPANSTTCFFSSWTSARGFLIRYCVSSIEACENPPLAALAILKARRRWNYSSCTRPPCLAIVADMLKTYKKLGAAANNKIRLVPQPYMHQSPPLRSLKPVLSTPGDAYH